MTRLRADLLLLVAALIWGTAFVAQKTANGTVGPILFVGGRFVLSAALLAPLAYRESRRRSANLMARDVALAAVIGLCLFAAATLQQIALTTATVTDAGFITALYIAFVPFVAWIVARTPIRPTVLAACAVSLIGAWLLTANGAAARVSSGDFLLLASAALFAAQITLIAKFLAKTHRPFFLSFVQFAVTAVLALAAGLALETADSGGVTAALPAILYTGLISGGIAYTLQVVAQRYTPAAEAALIMSLESVFAALGGALVLGDRLTPLAMLGCGLILLGVVMVEIVPALPRRRTA